MTDSVSQEVKLESRRITSQEQTSELGPGKTGGHSETKLTAGRDGGNSVTIAYQSIKNL